MSQCSMFKSCCFDEVKSSNGVDVVNTTVNQREAFESAISVIMVIRPESISQSPRLKTKPNIVTMAIFESVISAETKRPTKRTNFHGGDSYPLNPIIGDEGRRPSIPVQYFL